MTVKRQWMQVLIFSAIIAIAINSAVLSLLISRYFVGYATSNYNSHYDQIIGYAQKALAEENYTNKQLAIQLETHLDDPITRIRLYDADGQLLADVRNDGYPMMNGMMGSRFMSRMMGSPIEENDLADVSDTGILLGRLIITRAGSAGNSLATRMFKISLIGNSFFSFIIVLFFILIIGSIVSRKMSKDLIQTASQALSIDMDDQTPVRMSEVREIRIIQQSLETLRTRLRIRQTSRKKLVDELVHQTRTPLTILKTHLEGFEDGVISMTDKEIRTCEAQIENLTSIISNMSRMIDAEKGTENGIIEAFEFSQVLDQIIGGLKIQFDKKQIELSLLSHQKIQMKTDKYKLSQSIYNILTNAYKFTGQNGKVTVLYESDGEDLLVEIRDTGVGISALDKAHLFDAYFKGSNSSDVQGDGIGLFLVKENLDKIHGSVSVESELDKGSLFTIRIPREITS
ncbi:MAG: sensor histidine kinase [Saccharofermentanales bacterium]